MRCGSGCSGGADGCLGFFGVDPSTLRGAAEFLRTGEAILSAPQRALWVTAQGEFTDVRTRPLQLKTGVGHLADPDTIRGSVAILVEELLAALDALC